jgi:Fic family protein
MRVPGTYIHQLKEWPNFTWDAAFLQPVIHELQLKQVRLLSRMGHLGFSLRDEANINMITLDIIKSSEIEGEILNPELVRSSVARRLGLEDAGIAVVDRNIEGVVEMMLDATSNYLEPLTEERLYDWHAALFPTGRSGMSKIATGSWRGNALNDPMQVISGMMGREKIHFQAPDAPLLPDEMFAFLQWFNKAEDLNPFIAAAVAHLWFVTVHPFDDGNGRIARAITDMQLARADKSSLRFYSMSAQLRKERNRYYNILERTQKGSLDITTWLAWFIACLDRAMTSSEEILADVLRKNTFWNLHAMTRLNERQQLMLAKILDGYSGKITSSNWAKQTGSSTDSANRDINDLMQKGILIKGPAGGRSTSYLLADF